MPWRWSSPALLPSILRMKIAFFFEQMPLRGTNVLEAVLPHVMRTVQQLSHFSGMDVNVIWFPPAQDPGFHVCTNEPSIIFPPD